MNLTALAGQGRPAAPGGSPPPLAPGSKSVLTCALGAAAVHQEVQDQFTSAAPRTPGWESLAADLSPAAVLGRACLHMLARSAGCDRSAAELAAELPYLGVAQGEAKVRQVLRGSGPFTEAWRGRWHTAPILLRYLGSQATQAEAA